jgi:Nucleotidyl transferase AbiEii toxin, Type IV TA system
MRSPHRFSNLSNVQALREDGMFERIRHVPAELDVGDRTGIIPEHRAVLEYPAAQISERADPSTCPHRLRTYDDFRKVMRIDRRGAAAEATLTKRGERYARWRIEGTAAGEVQIVWEAEVSRRGVPPPEFVETKPFDTPIAYRIPPFSVRVYGAAAMAGGKVNALLSDNRSVPRDVYDRPHPKRPASSGLGRS